MITATIANGASLSGAISLLQALRATRLQMPAAWTTANLTFLISNDGGVSYQELYDGAGNEYTIVAAANRNILLDPQVFAGVTNFQIQSGTTASPVNQGAARNIIVNVV